MVGLLDGGIGLARSGPDKEIDDMFTPLVNESGDGAVRKIV